MPQLMPMYWFLSIFMIILLMLVILDLFFYKKLYSSILSNKLIHMNEIINFKW
uniref:ATP synthase F0 subunit 8 n=1 Tax=Cheiracanthium brevispinum TaxID=2773961 RepID=A0AA51VK35_9ARAC|nr:ATP synthase F0 subunit 8 [Cheiracanthium brevispinum]WMX19909.1 ATP synthase F0 subunit 8 [Cheiracanthium brevispinum]